MTRRALALVAIPPVVALGVASRRWPLGWYLWDKSVGDVAYAMLVGFILAALLPRLRASVVGALTALACFAIELFQLTGLPRRAPRLVHIALGDTFAWHDVACYVVGALLVVLVLELAGRRAC